MVAPVVFSGISNMAFTSASLGLSVSASSVLKDFFMNLFLHPEKHFLAIAVMGGATIAIFVGLAFLVKKLVEKYFPKPAPPPQP